MISGIAFAPHSEVSRSLRKAARSKANVGRRVTPVSFSVGRPAGTGSCPTTEIDRTVPVAPPAADNKRSRRSPAPDCNPCLPLGRDRKRSPLGDGRP